MSTLRIFYQTIANLFVKTYRRISILMEGVLLILGALLYEAGSYILHFVRTIDSILRCAWHILFIIFALYVFLRTRQGEDVLISVLGSFTHTTTLFICLTIFCLFCWTAIIVLITQHDAKIFSLSSSTRTLTALTPRFIAAFLAVLPLMYLNNLLLPRVMPLWSAGWTWEAVNILTFLVFFGLFIWRGPYHISLMILALCFLINLTILVICSLPSEAMQIFDSPSVLIAAFTFWLLVITLLIFVTKRFTVGFLFVMSFLIVVVGNMSFPAQHARAIRELKESAPMPVISPDLALEQWLAKQGPNQALIVIAAAGGGIRAAYWTASLLGRFQDVIPNFSKDLFGVSAVSGGSLGAATYLALLKSGDFTCVDAIAYTNGRFESCAKAALSADFLTPVLALVLGGETPLYNRADALELGWEAAWRRQISATNNPFAQPFKDLWPPALSSPNLAPALLLNGTSVISGERVVTSNLDVEQFVRVSVGYPINPAQHMNIKLSTAVDNSTRFPFVEPPGEITLHKPLRTPDGKTRFNDFVVDGGYYDNYGAATALDLLKNIVRSSVFRSREVRLIVIQITSNPDISDVFDDSFDDPVKGLGTYCYKEDAIRRASEQPDEESLVRRKEQTPNDLESVYQAAMNSRDRNGVVFALDLRRWTNDQHGKYFHFAMRDVNPPLGWSLSENARMALDRSLQNDCRIKRQIELLHNALKG